MVAGLLLRSGAAAATFHSDCAASAQKLIQRERRHPGPAVTATGTVTRLGWHGPGQHVAVAGAHRNSTTPSGPARGPHRQLRNPRLNQSTM